MIRCVGYAHWDYNADVPSIHAIGGWCWSEGDLTEFVGAKELASDVLWLTNLPWEYHVALGIKDYPNIKRHDFLPVAIERLAQELNIQPDAQEVYANAMSALGARLIALGQRCYGKNLLQECLKQGTLAQAIAHSIGWAAPTDEGMIDEELHREIIWQNLTTHALLRHDVQREDCVVLRAPFFTHAKNVLACPTPSVHEPWLEIHLAQADRLRYIQQEDLPAIVEVHDCALTSSWASLYDFSSTPHRWARRRRWMSSIEVQFLAELGAVEIGRIYIQPAGYICDATLSSMPNAGEALSLSMSAGLLSHAHWLSTAIPLTHRFWPARAMWARSADRLRLTSAVAALQSIRNLRIVSYGEGAVYISGPSDAVAQAISNAPHVGLAPTASTWAATSDHSMIKNETWLPQDFSAYEKAAIRLSNCTIADLLRLDAASIYSLTDESAAIGEIASILKTIQGKT
jgi:hypothetical protein